MADEWDWDKKFTEAGSGDDEAFGAAAQAHAAAGRERVTQLADHRRGIARRFTASRLAVRPVPERLWHVEDMIPARTVTMLGGDGGVGKSLVALQLAAATATGRPWLGRKCAAGGVVLLSAEDDEDELHRRLAAIGESEGLSLADLDRLTVVPLAGEDALLAIPDPRTGVLHPTQLLGELETLIAADPPALVVLDTLADLHSGNENDRTVARQFIGMLRGVAMRHDCAILLLAHPSLTGMATGSGLSGSTAWNASVRSRLYLERPEGEADRDRRRLVAKKSNYSRGDEEIKLTWREGVFVTDAVPDALDRMAAGAKAERVFLKLLDALTAQGRYVSATPGTNHAPKVFAAHPDAEGVTRSGFSRAMDVLFGRGTIAVEDYRTPDRKTRQRIARRPE
jgi:RecA-family ATPase